MSQICLCPAPRSLTLGDGDYYLTNDSFILLDDHSLWASVHLAAERNALTRSLHYAVKSLATSPAVTFFRDEKLEHEAYTLTVTQDCIVITYGDSAGAFYAMSTLVQVVESCGSTIPCMSIEDAPTFATRGYMLDIGRNKIPTLAECMELADFLASLKINHMELYIEGIPFEYPSFPHMWKGYDVMTGEDILALDEYCKARFIELVPTQNNFGHMDKWLLNEYHHLAECPDGFMFQGSFFPKPRCLNPLDPRSEELVRGLADDFLPYFSSDKYNICCDETLELGQGHSKELCEKEGMGRVYLDFLKKVCNAAQMHGKKILFWDDIIRNYPDLLPELPKDAIALEWGYLETEPHAEDCEKLQRYGVHWFVCPGTNAWNTFLGRTDQMKANIRLASKNALQYGAEGFLNTDWGDEGHLQSLPTAYAGILYGAAMAWSPVESHDLDLVNVLDTLIFKDAAHIMGQLVLDAGNYYLQEGTHPLNNTHSFQVLLGGIDYHAISENVTAEDYQRVDDYLAEIEARLTKVDLRCDRASLILDEYRLALGIVRMTQLMGKYHRACYEDDASKQIEMLDAIIDVTPKLAEELRRTWLMRNRYGYLDDSLARLTRVLYRAQAVRKELNVIPQY